MAEQVIGGFAASDWEKARDLVTKMRDEETKNRESGVTLRVQYGDPGSGGVSAYRNVFVPGNRLEGIDPKLLQGMVAQGPRQGQGQPRTFTNQYGTFTRDLGPSWQNPYGRNAAFTGVDANGNAVNASGQYWGYIRQGPTEERTYVPGWQATAQYLQLPGYKDRLDKYNFWKGMYSAYGTPQDPWYGLPVGTNIYGWYGFPPGWKPG